MISWKDCIPESIKTFKSKETPLHWMLKRLLGLKNDMGFFYPNLVKIAEVVLSTPVTNAWPERGVSALKRIKARLRNRIKNDMLNTLLQVKVNGPELKDKKTNIIIKHATAAYLKKRKRRKIPNLHKEVVSLSDDNQTKKAINILCKDSTSSDTDSESELDF